MKPTTVYEVIIWDWTNYSLGRPPYSVGLLRSKTAAEALVEKYKVYLRKLNPVRDEHPMTSDIQPLDEALRASILGKDEVRDLESAHDRCYRCLNVIVDAPNPLVPDFIWADPFEIRERVVR